MKPTPSMPPSLGYAGHIEAQKAEPEEKDTEDYGKCCTATRVGGRASSPMVRFISPQVEGPPVGSRALAYPWLQMVDVIYQDGRAVRVDCDFSTHMARIFLREDNEETAKMIEAIETHRARLVRPSGEVSKIVIEAKGEEE